LTIKSISNTKFTAHNDLSAAAHGVFDVNSLALLPLRRLT
jgi:hypothetical protein